MNVCYFNLILESMTVNYPILREWGYVLGKPLVLAFDNMETANSMVSQLSEKPKIIDAGMSDRQVRDILQYGTNSNAVVYFPDEGICKMPKIPKRMLMLDRLSSKENKAGCAVFIAVPAKDVSEELLQRYLCFHIDQSVPGSRYALDDIVPKSESLELIRDKITSIQGDAECKSFMAAACFLYPQLSENHKMMWQRLIRYVPQMMDFADSFAESRDMFEVICGCFIRFASQGGFESTIALPNVEREVIEDIDEYNFRNGGILYVSERKLREIVRPLMNIASLSDIKISLVAHHALITDRGGYTKKMQYLDPFGKICRHRMLALRIDKIKTNEGGILEYEI